MISLHEGRPRLSLDGVWKYALEGDEPGESLGYDHRDFDISSWKDMQLPINWYLTEVGDFFGTIWFRRDFRVPDELKGQQLFLRFGAVDYFADVWLNGEYLGAHEGMFNPFEFDVTDRVDLDGDNVVVVKDGAPRDDDRVRPGRLLQEPALGPLPHPPGEGDLPDQGPHDRRDAPAGLDDVVPLGRQFGGHLGERRAGRPPARVRRQREDLHEDRRQEGLARR